MRRLRSGPHLGSRSGARAPRGRPPPARAARSVKRPRPGTNAGYAADAVSSARSRARPCASRSAPVPARPAAPPGPGEAASVGRLRVAPACPGRPVHGRRAGRPVGGRRAGPGPGRLLPVPRSAGRRGGGVALDREERPAGGPPARAGERGGTAREPLSAPAERRPGHLPGMARVARPAQRPRCQESDGG
jgi:ATP-dependent RNA helicase SUPV3L1/SUV3